MRLFYILLGAFGPGIVVIQIFMNRYDFALSARIGMAQCIEGHVLTNGSFDTPTFHGLAASHE